MPPFGGDTLFANMYLAYETLSPGVQRLLDGLAVVNSSAKADVTKAREDRIREGAKADAKREYEALRPPGDRQEGALCQWRPHSALRGYDRGGKRPAVAVFIRSPAAPEFTCRFRWQAGSIAFWDNRCTQHNPINDYHGHRRILQRITLAGDKPR